MSETLLVGGKGIATVMHPTQEILDSIPAHLAVLDRAGTIVMVNARWNRFAEENGAPCSGEGTGIGTNYLSVCRNGEEEPDADQAHDLIQRALQGEQVEEGLEYPCHSPVEKRWFLMQVSPLLIPEGGAVVSHLNITSRILAEKQVHKRSLELAKERDRAQAAERAKQELLANVSHELKTPVAGILGVLSLLDSRDELSTEAQRQLALLNSSAEGLLHLVNDLLEYSTAAEGRLSIRPTEVHLVRLLEEAVTLLGFRAESKGVRMELEFGSGVPTWVRTDGIRLREVFLNLLSNAVKYTDEGSIEVDVLAEKRLSDTVRIRFEVRDSGSGMTDETMEGLFARYSRGRPQERRGLEGTGLGLVITQQIIRMLGGELVLESRLGKGTVASFSLPMELCQQPRVENAIRPVETDGTAAGSRILVADDDPTLQFVMNAYLKSLGYRVEIVGDGRGAVDRITSGDFAAAVVDVQMPGQTGDEAIRELRSKGSDLPLIAVSADDTQSERERCLEAGADLYLTKPVGKDTLAKSLRELLLSEVKK